MNDCVFSIEKHIATLSGSGEKVTKQINLVSWRGKRSMFDIRAWSSEGQPYKGLTLNTEEARVLRDALNGLDLGK